MRTTLAILTVILWTEILYSCAPVGRDELRLRITQENAIIVWDPSTKTQHFIRGSSFQTNGYDFGFLVPTPTQPKLTEVKSEAFPTLEALLVPEVIQKRPFFGLSRIVSRTMEAKLDKSVVAGNVRVLETKRLAGYDIAVLEADNAEKLNEWLGKHGYVSRPALVKWFEPYIAARWKITAFKVVPDAQGKERSQLDAIRMSFQTDRPFYPYREPEDGEAFARLQSGGEKGRSLRVFFIGTERVEGKIGASKDWPAKVAWAGPLPEQSRSSVATALNLPAESIPESAWMTAFEDRSSPRPGTDEVYFTRSADQSPVKPAPIIEYLSEPVIALDEILLVSLVLVLGFIMIRLALRARRLQERQHP